jgi:6,7-dimethyl-8-ribityllumazine synthase
MKKRLEGLGNERDRQLREKTIAGGLSARGIRFGIVVSRFNEFITDRLLRSAYDGLIRSEALENDIDIVRVPGAFEIPSAARTLAETNKYDAAHYDVIVNEVARGIGQSAQETGVPHAFGVLTCETLEQAIDRAGLKMGNKGFEAAQAAIEMANLKRTVSSQSSAVSKTVIVPRSSVGGKNNSAANPRSGGARKRKITSSTKRKS